MAWFLNGTEFRDELQTTQEDSLDNYQSKNLITRVLQCKPVRRVTGAVTTVAVGVTTFFGAGPVVDNAIDQLAQALRSQQDGHTLQLDSVPTSSGDDGFSLIPSAHAEEPRPKFSGLAKKDGYVEACHGIPEDVPKEKMDAITKIVNQQWKKDPNFRNKVLYAWSGYGVMPKRETPVQLAPGQFYYPFTASSKAQVGKIQHSNWHTAEFLSLVAESVGIYIGNPGAVTESKLRLEQRRGKAPAVYFKDKEVHKNMVENFPRVKEIMCRDGNLTREIFVSVDRLLDATRTDLYCSGVLDDILKKAEAKERKENHWPHIDVVRTVEVKEGEKVELVVGSYDQDAGQKVELTMKDKPTGANFDVTDGNGLFKWTPTKDQGNSNPTVYKLRFIADDKKGGKVVRETIVKVLNNPDLDQTSTPAARTPTLDKFAHKIGLGGNLTTGLSMDTNLINYGLDFMSEFVLTESDYFALMFPFELSYLAGSVNESGNKLNDLSQPSGRFGLAGYIAFTDSNKYNLFIAPAMVGIKYKSGSLNHEAFDAEVAQWELAWSPTIAINLSYCALVANFERGGGQTINQVLGTNPETGEAHKKDISDVDFFNWGLEGEVNFRQIFAPNLWYVPSLIGGVGEETLDRTTKGVKQNEDTLLYSLGLRMGPNPKTGTRTSVDNAWTAFAEMRFQHNEPEDRPDYNALFINGGVTWK